MGHVRVLVVDDDAAVRRSLSTALGRDGYEVVAADGGSAALARLAAGSVDAIVLDVAMPEPNGLEVCRRLRARGDRTPILMLTARGLVDDRVAGLDAGADDYLVKPFALAELRARLRGTTQLRRPGARPVCGTGNPGRARGFPHPHRVPAARTVPAQPWPGAQPLADLPGGVGLRLRYALGQPVGIHGLPAHQARGRG